ncbi:hypothetical protein SAMN03080598_01634 [Algoriphagus boritolerans DSM 17298 = JCM 18970]|uniref:Uncharacterized protein n=1 Tax=Algoriphagus boritolerans DSM 17298 = JCM 18970 TaxID=1120964 RepID=A0A1H5VCN2_9BACT|nr:hypothetical protein SAMN03080598_01634 [Algoriphagus boritolerans DSM 17298 = JCM 18970]
MPCRTQNHLKYRVLKYIHFIGTAFILFYFSTLYSYAQKACVDESLFREGLLDLV